LTDFNTCASPRNDFDAFKPLQAETAFTDDQTHKSAVRHRIEISLRRVNAGQWNVETIVRVARHAELHDGGRGRPRTHCDIICALGWIVMSRRMLGDDSHVSADQRSVIAVGDSEQAKQ
jgi:hypothetical protein